MLLFALLFKLYHITGGSDGLRVPLPTMFGFSFKGIRRPEFLSGTYYYFLLGMFSISFLIMKGIVSSPFGKALQAIRDNEVRAELIGIRVRRYRLYAFIISGMFVNRYPMDLVIGHVTADLSHCFQANSFTDLAGGFGIFEGPIIGHDFTYLKLYAMGIHNIDVRDRGNSYRLVLLPNGVAGAVSVYDQNKRKQLRNLKMMIT
jgi:branched-chain amino acid transport system permease protein